MNHIHIYASIDMHLRMILSIFLLLGQITFEIKVDRDQVCPRREATQLTNKQ